MATPELQPSSGIRIAASDLHAFVCAIWQAAGSEALEAQRVADHLVQANLAGHDSHGVGMIPRYAQSLAEGELKLNTHATCVRDAGAVLTVDGGLGFGQVVAHEAMALGIVRAGQIGICAVGLRNAHHIGRIGHWAEQCARGGMVSFHFVNVAGDPLVAPYGGIDARFGTNPFCAAFPRAGKAPIVLDFATSAIAYGKTRVAHNKGVEVPPGALIDHDGHPTRDPGVMHGNPRGALLAFGAEVAGHKGSGLAALCEIFGGALTGGLTSRPETLVRNSVIVNGMLSVIIDPHAFDAPDAQQEAEAFLSWLKTARPGQGFDEVKLPGEPEQTMRAQRSSGGIPIDAVSWAQITAAARELGVAAEQMPRVEAAD